MSISTFLFLLIAGVDVRNKNYLVKFASQAIASMLDQLSDKHNMKFRVVTLRDDVSFNNSKVYVNNILKLSSSPVIIDEEHEDTESFKFNRGVSYIFIGSRRIFESMELNTVISEFPIKRTVSSYGSTIILVYNGARESVQSKKPAKCTSSIAHKFFELFISNDYKSFKLYNCILFQKKSCETEWKLVNKFNISTLKWKSRNFVKYYKQFENCNVPLGVLAKLNNPVTNFLIYNNYTLRSGRSRLYGLEADFINLFTQVKRIKYPNDEAFYDNYMYGTFEYAIMPLQLLYTDRGIDFVNYDITVPLISLRFTFVVTRGLHFTPMQKLYLPFDNETWLCIIVTAINGLITIIVIKQLSKKVQDFVFGHNNRDPILNMAQIFFGIGLIRTPGRNFSRFFFISFSFFCLVMRNAYQGKMFEFITGNVRQPTARTIDDLNQMKIPVLSSEFIKFFG